MKEPDEDFTVIQCAYLRAHGEEQYDYFVKVDGRWVSVGAEDYGYEDSWNDATDGYARVTVVARPVAPEVLSIHTAWGDSRLAAPG